MNFLTLGLILLETIQRNIFFISLSQVDFDKTRLHVILFNLGINDLNKYTGKIINKTKFVNMFKAKLTILSLLSKNLRAVIFLQLLHNSTCIVN